jgi:predicted nucleic acid-binding protein
VIVVSDTSPITALLTIQKIDLLRQLYGTVIIPEAVAQELHAYHTLIPAFIQTASAEDGPLLEQLKNQLDPREAEAIVLAKTIHADVLLIDESLGRAAAKHEHLPVIGLMGVLLIAKKKGLVDAVHTLIEQLETEAGFYLSKQVKMRIIEAAGE